jgi:hypothetical protein
MAKANRLEGRDLKEGRRGVQGSPLHRLGDED